jgi:predicted metal-dependent hydrolase
VIPTLPLAARNRLAAAILQALHDPQARQLLHLLARGAAAEEWVQDLPPAATALMRLRAERAVTAIAQLQRATPDASLAQTLEQAAALFDAGLGFEVHELLEPHWVRACGDERSALQGLIQIAVGYQHLANGNRAGAQALLEEGSARARGHRLAGVDLDGFARAVAEAARQPGGPRSGKPHPQFPRGLGPP